MLDPIIPPGYFESGAKSVKRMEQAGLVAEGTRVLDWAPAWVA